MEVGEVCYNGVRRAGTEGRLDKCRGVVPVARVCQTYDYLAFSIKDVICCINGWILYSRYRCVSLCIILFTYMCYV